MHYNCAITNHIKRIQQFNHIWDWEIYACYKPACPLLPLSACLPAFLPACLPACLHIKVTLPSDQLA